ncbi:hypothetical protein N782_12850 [Pontibacillus yanchengensis Y32]|uniref:Uncharacterized protein n=1 Tax=Pontibacillus yanchengensis Y32 TaxID=1385514 RepID=A0A0A2TKB0_9BACI|nr:hypothetical protein N782_12850 [Pontibacillus yanchengensis Y32]
MLDLGVVRGSRESTACGRAARGSEHFLGFASRILIFGATFPISEQNPKFQSKIPNLRASAHPRPPPPAQKQSSN